MSFTTLTLVFALLIINNSNNNNNNNSSQTVIDICFFNNHCYIHVLYGLLAAERLN